MPHPRTPSLPCPPSLNESPSEKEGKYLTQPYRVLGTHRLNESPSEKEGKLMRVRFARFYRDGLNESPSEKEGKLP